MKFDLGNKISRGGSLQSDSITLSSNSLLKHAVIFGGSGSGKTYLLKKLIQEMSLQNIPSLIIDTQGDFSSLILAKDKFADVEKVIFTPTKNEGIPMSFSPFFDTKKIYDEQELIDILSNSSDSLVGILGYDVFSDDGKSASGALYLVLKYFYDNKIEITFSNLISVLQDNKVSATSQFLTKSKIASLIKKLKLLSIGRNKLIFEGGFQLNFNKLFEKPRLNIINLTGIDNKDVRHYVLNMIISNLYNWMIKNPSSKLQASFVIDEIAEYIPAGSKKPLTKDLLQTLFKQARKFGISCLIATQNPGDIDYKSLAQFSTWAIGRLNTKQDFKKIESAINSISNENNFAHDLPSLKTGQFLLYSPDNYDGEILFKCGELMSEHKALSLREVAQKFDKKKYADFLTLKSELNSSLNNSSSVDEPIKKQKGFPINLESDELSKVIQKHKKKFLMIFSNLEQVGDVELKYLPIYYCKLRVKESSVFGLRSKINDYNAFFDARTFNPLHFNHFDFQVLTGFNHMVELNETDRKVLKYLVFNPKMSSADIGLKLNLGTKTVYNSIKRIKEKNLIAQVDDGKLKKHSLMVEFNVPVKFKKIATYEDYTFYNLDVSDNFDLPSLDNLKSVLDIWYGECLIDDYELIYLPYYEITLLDKKNKRTLCINASSGNLINF